MKQQLTEINEARLQMLINAKHIKNERNDQELQAIERKLQSAQKRKTEIIKGNSKIQIINVDNRTEQLQEAIYACHNKWLHKQKDLFYLEERIEYRKASFYQDELVDDQLVTTEGEKNSSNVSLTDDVRSNGLDFLYDRMAAVQYAERWWNSSNTQYKNFDVNCTNFISQCLHAGGAKMRGYPNRSNGWWMQSNNWSYSWTVAHSMKVFLSNSRVGLRGEIVQSPELLMPGDVICYDFQGDGRFDHTTFVVAKDEENMPLVNAQTYNSRMRYWAYEDSTAYTPNIKYAFFRILDDTSSK